MNAKFFSLLTLLCTAVSCSAVTVTFSQEELTQKLREVGLFTSIQKSRIIRQLGDNQPKEASHAAAIVTSVFNAEEDGLMVAPQTRKAAVAIVFAGHVAALQELRTKQILS